MRKFTLCRKSSLKERAGTKWETDPTYGDETGDTADAKLVTDGGKRPEDAQTLEELADRSETSTIDVELQEYDESSRRVLLLYLTTEALEKSGLIQEGNTLPPWARITGIEIATGGGVPASVDDDRVVIVSIEEERDSILELVERGLSPAEAVDYYATLEQRRTQQEWATARGLDGHQSVGKNTRRAREKLSED